MGRHLGGVNLVTQHLRDLIVVHAGTTQCVCERVPPPVGPTLVTLSLDSDSGQETPEPLARVVRTSIVLVQGDLVKQVCRSRSNRQVAEGEQPKINESRMDGNHPPRAGRFQR